MSKHTPGPWKAFNTSDIFTPLFSENAEGIRSPSNDGWMIADCDMGALSIDEVRANVRLICAAPDLLEALEAAAEALEAAEFFEKAAMARAAIAKAKGESA